MKRILLSALIVFSAATYAQNIPNPGFETWVNTGSYEDPQGWGTYNFLSLYGNALTATKTTDKHSGTYAIRMESKLVTNNPNPAIIPDTVHTIYSGSTVPLVFGFPYTQKPEQLQMYYKSIPANGSDAGVLAYLLKWNPAQHKRDTVAKAASYLPAASAYTQMNVPFIYFSTTMTPDTAVIFTSPIAYGTPHQLGAVLFVDDFSFVMSTGINEEASKAPKLVYTAGSFGLTNVSSPSRVCVYSVEGKVVLQKENVTNNSFPADLSAGVYTYAIESAEGRFSGKVAVVR